jgi:hypothetical protein
MLPFTSNLNRYLKTNPEIREAGASIGRFLRDALSEHPGVSLMVQVARASREARDYVDHVDLDLG